MQQLIGTPPHSPGVYQFLDHKGHILYIGKAKNLAKRLMHYFTPGSLRKQEMVATADKVTWIETPSEADALLLEDNLIKQYLPEYNTLLKNNSNYVFLKISRAPFPTFRIVKKRVNDGSTYIGPRYNSKQLWELLRHLRHLFKFHTMKPTEFAKGVLSSDYFFGLDLGRSVIACLGNEKKTPLVEQAKRQGRKQEKSYEAYVAQYALITKTITNCFEGRTAPVLQLLKEQIEEAIQKQHFERCTLLRDVYTFVQSLDRTYQHIVLKKPVSGYIGTVDLVADARVITLAQLTDGKVVDVIRTHFGQSERMLSELISSLGVEFGCTKIISQTDTHLLIATPSLLPLNKKELAQLQELFDTAQNSYIQTTAYVHEDNLMESLLRHLQETYMLKRIPLHIECADISHLSGSYISGGLSCFRHGLPDKKFYRQYKITTVADGMSDDYQSLKELLIRRYKLTKDHIGTELLPDLFILDGGKGQLGILRELKKEYPVISELMDRIDIVALGKGEARQRTRKLAGAPEIIYTFGPDRTIQAYPLAYTHADQILVNIRDEAHRFANRYRKKQTEKQRKQ